MSHGLKIALAFVVVYVVWGSTYLGIRIAVRDLPPGLLAGVRFVLAGLIMLSIALALRMPLPRTRHDWVASAVMGLLLVVLGNGLVTWGEQWVESNQAALLVSTGAIWTTWLGTFGPRATSVSGREKLGVAIGLVGASLMLWPKSGLQFDYFYAQAAILGAPLAWSAGTIYARNYPVSVPPLMFTATQMLIGGMFLLVYGLLAGELPRWQWTVSGMAALAYLTLFGSCVAYGTYVWLIHETSPVRLGTIAYVNPMVAIVLGWIVLNESLDGTRLAGALVILLAVALVTIKPRRRQRID